MIQNFDFLETQDPVVSVSLENTSTSAATTIDYPSHKTLFKKDYAEISLSDKGDKSLIIRWKGDVDDESYKIAVNQLLEFGREHKISSLLIDTNNLGQVSMFARAWLMLDWMPRLKDLVSDRSVYPKLAILCKESTLHKVGINYVTSYLQQLISYDCRFYVDEDKAINWLSESRYKH